MPSSGFPRSERSHKSMCGFFLSASLITVHNQLPINTLNRKTKLSKRHSDTISHTISPTFPLIKTPKYGVPVVGTVFFSDLCNDYPINYEDPTTRTAPARSRHPRTAACCGDEHRPPLHSRTACPVMSPAIQNHRTCTTPQTSNSAS